MRLFLLRHSRPCADQSEICIGDTDFETEPVSPAHLEALAGELRECAAITSSNLTRAATLAARLAAMLDIPHHTDTRVRELAFGSWEGRAWLEIEESEGEAFAAWGADWTNLCPHGGESYARVAERAQAWVGSASAAAPQSTICLVAHAGPIRALIGAALNIPLESALRIDVGYLSLSCIDYPPDRPPRVHFTNDCPV